MKKNKIFHNKRVQTFKHKTICFTKLPDPALRWTSKKTRQYCSAHYRPTKSVRLFLYFYCFMRKLILKFDNRKWFGCCRDA